MTIRGKHCVLVALFLTSIGLVRAENCADHLQESKISLRDSINNITENFVIPKESHLGFQKLDKIAPNKNQALRLYKLMLNYDTTYEDLHSIFMAVVELFDTHRIEDIVHIIETAASEDLKPEKLAEVLSRIQKELPLIKKQLGFAEKQATFEVSEAKLHEALLLFKIMGQREGTLTLPNFQEEIDLIVQKISPNDALDVLSILETALAFQESVESIVKQILEIQDAFVLEKRSMGFSPNTENKHRLRADVNAALGILEILDESGMSLEELLGEFEEYKTLAEAPSIDHFLMEASQQLQVQLEEIRQEAQKELERVSSLN